MKFLILLAAIALLPLGAFAADNDVSTQYRSGDWYVMEIAHCDGVKTAVGDCTEIDLHAGRAGDNSWPGMPEFVVVEISADNCTTEHIGRLVGLSESGSTVFHDLTADLEIVNTSHTVVNPISHRFLLFNVTTGGTGGTCNDFEVLLRLFYGKQAGL
jgi:hypothetical protein